MPRRGLFWGGGNSRMQHARGPPGIPGIGVEPHAVDPVGLARDDLEQGRHHLAGLDEAGGADLLGHARRTASDDTRHAIMVIYHIIDIVEINLILASHHLPKFRKVAPR
jgi:hypothetical protein